MRKSEPDSAIESPIPFRAGSNGEFAPLPETDMDRRAEAAYRALVDERARKLGVSRRDFVRSACGTTAALFVINQTYGCGAHHYAVDAPATVDKDVACAKLAGDPFVFDVQTHHVELSRDWHELNFLAQAIEGAPYPGCGEATRLACWSADHYIREIFVKSDTAVACLTLFPGRLPKDRPLRDEEAAATRELVDRLARSPRLLIHGMVNPELGAAQLDDMQRMKESSRVNAWKVYTQMNAWRLDDDKIGTPFLERARALGVRIVCAHKGLSFPDIAGVGGHEYGSPADIGPAAKRFPDINFLVYHAGYEPGGTEGPYHPDGQGIDRLIRSMRDAGVGPGANVYAELGSTWRLLMTLPVDAAHALGKLFLHVGQDNVLWGTDSLWFGTPQPQIEAFRAFEIPTELQEKHGYPALTPALKAKVLGLNAARVYGVDPTAARCAIREDDLAKRKAENDHRPLPRLGPVGPATRRDFIALFKKHLAGGVL
jgi:predicted TIM-barrel fold metal-dependent hydrolase